ncbi:MAG: hypothetical protein H0T89_07530 [Deltaproteobacteria bacterium]|nr:hypothetical protein [Deltaproteobacteria bacterium]
MLRVIDSLQLTAKHKVAMPSDWKQGQRRDHRGLGERCDAKTLFPNGWKTVKPYLRVVPQPKSQPGTEFSVARTEIHSTVDGCASSQVCSPLRVWSIVRNRQRTPRSPTGQCRCSISRSMAGSSQTAQPFDGAMAASLWPCTSVQTLLFASAIRCSRGRSLHT